MDGRIYNAFSPMFVCAVVIVLHVLVFNRGSAATRCHKCDLEEVNCGTITIASVHMCNVLWLCGLGNRRPSGFARLWPLALAFWIRGVSVARFSGTYLFGIPVHSGGV